MARKKRLSKFKQDLIVGSAAIGSLVSCMAIANLPDVITNPSLTVPNVLTASWVLGGAFLAARIVSKIERKVLAAIRPAAASQSRPRRKAPLKRAIQNDEKWLAHLRRSAATVRVKTEPVRKSAAHGIYTPIDFDDDISDVGTGRPALAADLPF
jgi:hypothetical protein